MKEKGRRQMAIVTDDIKEGALCKGMKRDVLVWKYMFRSYVLELSQERRLWMNELPVQKMQFSLKLAKSICIYLKFLWK